MFNFFHFNNASFIRNVFNSAWGVDWLSSWNNSWGGNNGWWGLISNKCWFNSVDESGSGDWDLLEACSLDWNVLNSGNWNVLNSNNLLDGGGLNNWVGKRNGGLSKNLLRNEFWKHFLNFFYIRRPPSQAQPPDSDLRPAVPGTTQGTRGWERWR